MISPPELHELAIIGDTARQSQLEPIRQSCQRRLGLVRLRFAPGRVVPVGDEILLFVVQIVERGPGRDFLFVEHRCDFERDKIFLLIDSPWLHLRSVQQRLAGANHEGTANGANPQLSRHPVAQTPDGGANGPVPFREAV